MASRKRILVGVLDWGLGHAARSVPLVNALVENGCDVTVASSGDALALLKKTFSDLPSVTLPGYNVRYGNFGSALPVLFQLPRMMRVVMAEHALVEDLLKTNPYDAIVSDNRYGLYSERVPSVIVTHQLRLVASSVAMLASPVANQMLKRYVNRFAECWVPDTYDGLNLSGKMSHGVKLQIPVRYIGPLSRLNRVEKKHVDFDLLALLSGPEPQRTILERQVLEQVANTRLKVCLVQGLVSKSKTKIVKDNLETHTYAASNDIEDLVSRSKFVLSRSGYSSVMDLCRLDGKAMLVPTPGQPEQEYLAKTLSKNNWCLALPQHKLDVFGSLQDLERLGGFPQQFDFNAHKQVIKEWLQRI